MKKLFLLLFPLLSPFLFAQSGQISSTVLQNASGYAKIPTPSSVYVCAYNGQNDCTVPDNEIAIYSDATLTQIIDQPLLSDDNGRYSYYLPTGTLALEKVCFTAQQCQVYQVFVPTGSTLTPPNSSLLGGTGLAFSSVSIGSGLQLNSGVLSAIGGTTPPSPAFVVPYTNAGVTGFLGDFQALNINPTAHSAASATINAVPQIAVGLNGITSSGDQTTSVQNVINRAGATGQGQTVAIQPGSYQVGPLSINGPVDFGGAGGQCYAPGGTFNGGDQGQCPVIYYCTGSVACITITNSNSGDGILHDGPYVHNIALWDASGTVTAVAVSASSGCSASGTLHFVDAGIGSGASVPFTGSGGSIVSTGTIVPGSNYLTSIKPTVTTTDCSSVTAIATVVGASPGAIDQLGANRVRIQQIAIAGWPAGYGIKTEPGTGSDASYSTYDQIMMRGPGNDYDLESDGDGSVIIGGEVGPRAGATPGTGGTCFYVPHGQGIAAFSVISTSCEVQNGIGLDLATDGFHFEGRIEGSIGSASSSTGVILEAGATHNFIQPTLNKVSLCVQDLSGEYNVIDTSNQIGCGASIDNSGADNTELYQSVGAQQIRLDTLGTGVPSLNGTAYTADIAIGTTTTSHLIGPYGSTFKDAPGMFFMLGANTLSSDGTSTIFVTPSILSALTGEYVDLRFASPASFNSTGCVITVIGSTPPYTNKCTPGTPVTSGTTGGYAQATVLGGLWVSSNDGRCSILSSGSEHTNCSGTTAIATATTSIIMVMNFEGSTTGQLQIFCDSGLTPRATFTPTTCLNINAGQLRTNSLQTLTAGSGTVGVQSNPYAGLYLGASTSNFLELLPNPTTTPYRIQLPAAQPTTGNPYLSCTNANPAICTWGAGGASGTITSITASTPLTGGTITSSGSIGIQNATSSQLGAVQCDGVTITCNPSTGVISASTLTAASLRGFCNGVATSSTTIALYGFGQVSSTNCTATASNGGAFLANRSGVFKNLYIAAIGSGGVNSSSGVVTLYDNGVAESVTCTIGTSTSCNDTTHTFTATAGHFYTLRVTTQASETLSGLNASIDFQ